jgi:hypothetical protein
MQGANTACEDFPPLTSAVKMRKAEDAKEQAHGTNASQRAPATPLRSPSSGASYGMENSPKTSGMGEAFDQLQHEETLEAVNAEVVDEDDSPEAAISEDAARMVVVKDYISESTGYMSLSKGQHVDVWLSTAELGEASCNFKVCLR